MRLLHRIQAQPLLVRDYVFAMGELFTFSSSPRRRQLWPWARWRVECRPSHSPSRTTYVVTGLM